jgi:hypothetical protein
MEPMPGPYDSLSVTDPIGKAIERTRYILFRTGNAGKWFILGFCVFLAKLLEGGGPNFGQFATGPPAPAPGGPPGPGGSSSFSEWLASNIGWIVFAVVAFVIVIIGLAALVLWLRARGRFMFLAGVARNQAAVVKPWHEFRALGNSLFGFMFTLTIVLILALFLFGAVGVMIAWTDIQAEQFGTSATVAIIVFAFCTLAATVLVSIINALLIDFVVPTMYLRNERVMDAWSTAHQEVFSGRTGTIVLFYLMRIVLGIAIGFISVLVVLFTCCLAGVPYIGSVILLPVHVFMRSYSLCFLEQLGPTWQFFQPDVWPPRCMRCNYDLRANVSGVCPECGTPVPPTPPVARPADGPVYGIRPPDEPDGYMR